jgi:hypothetical protein
MERGRKVNGTVYPTRGGSKGWGKGAGKEPEETKGSSNELQEVKKQLKALQEQLQKTQDPPVPEAGDASVEQGKKSGGFPKELRDKLVTNSKQRTFLNNLDEIGKIFIGGEEALQKALGANKKERDDLYGKQRASLPLKDQHAKCATFLEKLNDELVDLDAEYMQALLKYEQLDQQIEKKRELAKAKQKELEELNCKMAQELSTKEAKPAPVAAPGGLAKAAVASLVSKEECHLLQTFVNIAASSPEVLALLQVKGGNEMDFQKMQGAWERLTAGADVAAAAAERSPGLPSEPAVVSEPAATALALAPASTPGLASPAKRELQHTAVTDPHMDCDEMPEDGQDTEWDQAWELHVNNHPNFDQMERDEYQKAKTTIWKIRQKGGGAKKHRASD